MTDRWSRTWHENARPWTDPHQRIARRRRDMGPGRCGRSAESRRRHRWPGLANGHWLLIYNDTDQGHNSLAVSISEDEGKSWTIAPSRKARRRQLPLPGRDSGVRWHAPLHLQLLVKGGKSMKHVAANEAWVAKETRGRPRPGHVELPTCAAVLASLPLGEHFFSVRPQGKRPIVLSRPAKFPRPPTAPHAASLDRRPAATSGGMAAS